MYTRRRLVAAGAVGIAALSGCTDFIAGDEPLSETAEPAVVDDSTLEETGYELVDQDTETVAEEVEVAGQTRQIEAVNQLSVYERAIDLAGDELSDEDFDEDDFDDEELDEDDLDEFDDEELPDDIDEEDIPDGVTNSFSTDAVDTATVDGAAAQLDTDDDRSGSVFMLFSTPAFSIAGQSFNPVGGMANDELAELLSSEVDELTVGEQVAETSRTVLDAETTVTTFDATASATGDTVDMVVELTAVETGEDYVIGFAAYPQLLESTEADRVEKLFGGIEHPAE